MRDLVSIEGAPLDEELAQKYFDALPERACAFLDRLVEEAARNRVSHEAQLQACDAHRAELADAEARRDAFKRGMREGSKEDVARLAVHESAWRMPALAFERLSLFRPFRAISSRQRSCLAFSKPA